MNNLHFVWDDQKAAANYRKHGISFEEAQSVFADEYARLRYDQIIPRTKTALFYLA